MADYCYKFCSRTIKFYLFSSIRILVKSETVLHNHHFIWIKFHKCEKSQGFLSGTSSPLNFSLNVISLPTDQHTFANLQIKYSYHIFLAMILDSKIKGVYTYAFYPEILLSIFSHIFSENKTTLSEGGCAKWLCFLSTQQTTITLTSSLCTDTKMAAVLGRCFSYIFFNEAFIRLTEIEYD